MSLKFLRIPERVEIAASVEEPPIPGVYQSFAAGIEYLIDTHEEFAAPLSRVRVGARLVAAIENAEPGSIVELRADDWDILQKAIEPGKARWGLWWHQSPAGFVELKVPPRKFLPWANAISEATNEPPNDTKQPKTTEP